MMFAGCPPGGGRNQCESRCAGEPIEVATMGIENPIQLPSLDISLQTLKHHFNQNHDRLRFLALLSPT